MAGMNFAKFVVGDSINYGELFRSLSRTTEKAKFPFFFFGPLPKDKLNNNDPNNREPEKEIHSRGKRREIMKCPFPLIKCLCEQQVQNWELGQCHF